MATKYSCPQWCDGNHPSFDWHMSGDQFCFVPLAASPFGEGRTGDGEVQVFIAQHLREAGPSIVVELLPTGEPKFAFSPEGALHLSEALKRMAEVAIDNKKSQSCEACTGHPT